MAKIIEDNPVISLVGYTILVAGATWGISTFILHDNRLNLANSELESQKAVIEQYKDKNELLQHDIDALRAENAEYRNWLGQTKDAIPLIVPRITELKQRIASFEAEARAQPRAANTEGQIREGSASVGSAFIDDATGLVFTVKKTNTDETALVSVKLPGASAPTDSAINAGQQWHFAANNTKYLLTVTNISFVSDVVRLRITTEQ